MLARLQKSLIKDNLISYEVNVVIRKNMRIIYLLTGHNFIEFFHISFPRKYSFFRTKGRIIGEFLKKKLTDSNVSFNDLFVPGQNVLNIFSLLFIIIILTNTFISSFLVYVVKHPTNFR